MKTSVITRLLGLFLISSASQASSEDHMSQRPYKLSVGVLGYASTSPFKSNSDDVDSGFVPYIELEIGRFTISPSGASYVVYSERDLDIQALLTPRWVTADPSELPGLGALKRDTAIELGVRATKQLGAFELNAEYHGDVSDTHGGHAINAALRSTFVLGQSTYLSMEAGLEWNDESLGTYRYGVRPSEASGTLAAYTVPSHLTPSVGAEIGHRLTERVSLLAGVRVEFLPKEVSNSPIVVNDQLFSSYFGMTYDF